MDKSVDEMTDEELEQEFVRLFESFDEERRHLVVTMMNKILESQSRRDVY